MSNYYTNLIEKIEKQNSSALEDKMEVQYQLRDLSRQTQDIVETNVKYFKILVAMELAQLGMTNLELLTPLLQVL